MSSDRILGYILVGVFSLMVTILIWYGGWYWLGISELTALLLTVLAVLVPWLSYEAFLRSAEAVANAPASASTPPQPRVGLTEWLDGWLRWLGSGEPHRGTLVFLVILFWSLFFWSLPTITFTVFTFSGWGLVTTFMLVLIRSVFFRQTAIPGQEVPAASADTKSQTKG
jgi:hypothetical protein